MSHSLSRSVRLAARHPWHAAWAALAAANLAVGVYLSLRPGRTEDLLAVAMWVRSWLHGVSPYTVRWTLADYPPQALVALSPLALVPAAWLPAVWTAINVVLAPLVAWLAVDLAPPRDGARRVLLVLMLLSCGCMRTLNQFTLLLLAAGFVAMRLRGPLASGLLLALALVKPQVGLPFALWAVLTRRFRAVAVAAVATAAAVVTFSLRLTRGPATVLSNYLVVLAKLYASDARLTGATGLQTIVRALTPSLAVADAVFTIVTLGLLGWVVVSGLHAGPTRAAPAIVAVGGLWCLATFRFLSYGLVLAFPALVWLAADDETSPWPRADRWVFAVVLGRLVLSIPAFWRHFLDAIPSLDVLDGVVLNMTRWLVLSLLVYLLVRLQAQRRAGLKPGTTYSV